jgi:hypothetical protein
MITRDSEAMIFLSKRFLAAVCSGGQSLQPRQAGQFTAPVSGSCSIDFRALRARTCFKNGRL